MNHDAVGSFTEPTCISWDSQDAMLYALGVGAGLHDHLCDLCFTTENSAGISQRTLPTFGLHLSQRKMSVSLGDFDTANLIHAGQQFELLTEVPVQGSAFITARIESISDLGTAALGVIETVMDDASTGERLLTAKTTALVKGAGGFGGEVPARDDWERPSREPDLVEEVVTLPGQSLLYRLSGDRNPLHSDPAFAQRAGFEGPILHGMCTYGMTARVLAHAFSEEASTTLRAMSGRFSAPAFPGDTLEVRAWFESDGMLFQTSRQDGTVVIDKGRANLTG